MNKLILSIIFIGYTFGLSSLPSNMYIAEIVNKTDDWYYFATTQLYGDELNAKLTSGAKAAEAIAQDPSYSWEYYSEDSKYYADVSSVRLIPGNGTFTVDKDPNWLSQFAFTDGRGQKIYNTLILVPIPDPGLSDTCAPYIFIGPLQVIGYRAQGYNIAKTVEGVNCCIDGQGNLCQNDSLMGWSEIRNFKPTEPFTPTKLRLTIDPTNPDPAKRILLEQI